MKRRVFEKREDRKNNNNEKLLGKNKRNNEGRIDLQDHWIKT